MSRKPGGVHAWGNDSPRPLNSDTAVTACGLKPVRQFTYNKKKVNCKLCAGRNAKDAVWPQILVWDCCKDGGGMVRYHIKYKMFVLAHGMFVAVKHCPWCGVRLELSKEIKRLLA